MRSRRQGWAAPGGNHDKLVRILGIALPASVGVLAAFLATAPLQNSSELNFLVSRDNVEVAQERLRVERARYSGVDNRGQSFELNAAGAVQRSSDTPIVELDDLSAQIDTEDGLAFIAANQGNYNIDDQIVAIDGPLEFRAADGYALRTRNVRVDLGERTMRATDNVAGEFPNGTFRADRMLVRMGNRTMELAGDVRGRLRLGSYSAQRVSVNMDNRSVVLDGRARLRIRQGGGR